MWALLEILLYLALYGVGAGMTLRVLDAFSVGSKELKSVFWPVTTFIGLPLVVALVVSGRAPLSYFGSRGRQQREAAREAIRNWKEHKREMLETCKTEEGLLEMHSLGLVKVKYDQGDIYRHIENDGTFIVLGAPPGVPEERVPVKLPPSMKVDYRVAAPMYYRRPHIGGT